LIVLRDAVWLRIEDELMTEDDDPIGTPKASPPQKATKRREHSRCTAPIGRAVRCRAGAEVLYHTGAACGDAIRLGRGNQRLIEFDRGKTRDAVIP
jgi:hypothetical protein